MSGTDNQPLSSITSPDPAQLPLNHWPLDLIWFFGATRHMPANRCDDQVGELQTDQMRPLFPQFQANNLFVNCLGRSIARAREIRVQVFPRFQEFPIETRVALF